jgi:cell division protein FtsX
MTRNPTRLALVAPVVVLLLAGCGGGGSGQETTTATQVAKLVPARIAQPTGCFLTVFLSESHTKAQRNRVQLLLLTRRGVLEVAFVSKELALERFERKQPDVVIFVNPFSDSFEVVPATRGTVFSLITDFAAGVDGVTNVRASRACGTA